MAIQSDETLVTKGDLKELYQDKILPYLGGNIALSTNIGDYYSADEKMIGVWTNGKPLYQKTFAGNCSGGNVMTAIATNVKSSLNIEEVVDFRGSVNYNNSGGWIPLVYAWVPSNNDYQTAYLSADGTLYCGGKYSGKTIITLQYTKTTDTADSAVTTPGCYDLNRPDLWPSGKEIFFGNGLYGKRFIGTFTSPTSFNTNIAQLDTIDRGTTFKFINRGGNIFRRNDTAMPLGVQDTLQYDIWYANSSSSQDVGLRLRGKDNGAYSCSYDIWVTYTK